MTETAMTVPGKTAFVNARIFDGRVNRLLERQTVFVEGERIAAIAERAVPTDTAVIDCGGRVLMPGLIDAHVHAYAHDVNPNIWATSAPTLYAHHAAFMLRRMLDRGFTTVRDVGGADHGLAQAITRGYFPSPRLLYCGRFISMTGGHGDFRPPHHHESTDTLIACGCGASTHISAIVDGVPAVLRAVRENLRRGAHFIKIMGSGGVASTGDSLHGSQFCDEELRAIVSEVERHGTYCTAHAHPDNALRRAIELGVHGIEHGTLIERDTAALAAERGVSITPTLAIIAGLAAQGDSLGLPKESMAKLALIQDEAVTRMGYMKEAGVRIGFGTDLLGSLENLQMTEFALRAPIFSPFETVAQATSINADILRMKDRIGVISPGAFADILVIDGNPLEDIGVWTEDGARLDVIMTAGHPYRNRLGQTRDRRQVTPGR
jgi:imidazolonepropionase-like amidohydrolase